jgi:hypothetical protein
MVIMSKDTFYFKHECNARDDRKLVNVIRRHGMQGIGIYWCLIEMLYEEGGYLPLELERISYVLRTAGEDVIESVIRDFDLFKIGDKYFHSEAVLEQLKDRCDKSEKAKKAINYRWEKLKPYERITPE